MTDRSVQETYASHHVCFGCGPSNPKGLRIRSFRDDGGLKAVWTPEPHHDAFPGMLSGGIAGTLLDCHSNWTAAIHLMEKSGADSPPCTVTAAFSVKLLKPTPTEGKDLVITSRVAESGEDRAVIEAEITAGGEITATCRGTFVAVKPGHPAYHRW